MVEVCIIRNFHLLKFLKKTKDWGKRVCALLINTVKPAHNGQVRSERRLGDSESVENKTSLT